MSEEEVKKEEELAPDKEMVQLLDKLPNRPGQEQIDGWKAVYGDVFVSGFSEEELYVWRSLTRKEYINLQTTGQETGMNQFQMEEATCGVCVLWPENIEECLQKKAGTAGSLHEQILQNSNFFSPQAASILVAKL